jgi:hypothetical protein
MPMNFICRNLAITVAKSAHSAQKVRKNYTGYADHEWGILNQNKLAMKQM